LADRAARDQGSAWAHPLDMFPLSRRLAVQVSRMISGAWLRYVEWACAPILAVTVVFSWAHEEYGTAVIVAACAGFVLGVQLGATILRKT